MSLLYKFINPPVKMLLKSPLHSIMSNNTLLLEFTGRKSGRALSTPISYHIVGDHVHCITSKAYGWWRNLVTDENVFITIKGQRKTAKPMVEADDKAKKSEAIKAMLIAVPRDAVHAGVKLDDRGQPDADDIRNIAGEMVHLSFELV